MSQRPQPETRNAGAPFWKAAAEGRLALPRCKRCAKAFWYPRWACPRCDSEDIEWMTASGAGRVHTFTVVRQSADPFFKTRVPYIVAVIELEEGPLLVSGLVDCAPEAARIGMPVQVAFEPGEKGIAIPVFRP
jgi:hypothetical protein